MIDVFGLIVVLLGLLILFIVGGIAILGFFGIIIRDRKTGKIKLNKRKVEG